MTPKSTLFCIVLCSCLLTACGGGGENGGEGEGTPKNLSLTWDIPTTRENGEALSPSEISGYSIKYRLIGEDIYTTVFLEDNNSSQFSTETLPPGSYEFIIAAVDVDGLFGEFSEPITGSI